VKNGVRFVLAEDIGKPDLVGYRAEDRHDLNRPLGIRGKGRQFVLDRVKSKLAALEQDELICPDLHDLTA
jgi:hypothetical protein